MTSATSNWDRTARVAAHAVRAPLALVTLVREGQLVVCGRSSAVGVVGGEGWMTRVQTLCHFVIAAGESLLIERLDQDPLFRVGEAEDSTETGAFAGLPLRGRDGEVRGCLWVVDPEPRSWSPADAEVLRDIADGAAESLEPLEPASATSETARVDEAGARLRAIAVAATGVFNARSEDELQDVLRRACAEVVPFDAFLFALYDADADSLRFLGGYDAGVYAEGEDVPVPGTPSEQVIRERRSLLTPSAADPTARGARMFGTGRRSQSAIRSPILAGDTVLGMLSVQSYEPERYGPDDVAILEVLAAVAATALTNFRLEQERHASSNARRQAEHRFSLLMDRVQDYAICLLDSEGRITSWNLGAQRLTGYTEVEAVGQHIALFYPPDAQAEGAHVLSLATALETGRYEEEGWRARKDGTRFWAHVVMVPIYDEDGRHAAFAKISRDLTEMRRVQQEAQLRDAYLERLFDAAPEGIVLLDNEDRVLRVNEEFTRMFGYGSDEVVGRPINELIVSPEEHEAAYALTQRAARGERLSTEAVRRRHDGSPIPVSILATPVQVEGEQLAVYAIYRDLSEHKRAEAALEEAEARYRTLVERAPLITYVTAPHEASDTVYFSPQLEKILGFSPDELRETPGLWRDQLHPDDRERVLEELARAQQAGERFSQEYRMLARDGEVLWFYDEALPLSGAEEGASLHGVMLDITDRKRAEAALQESEERFRSLIENSSDVVAIVSAGGTIKYVTPSINRLLGYTPDDLVGSSAFALLFPDDAAEVMERFTGLMRGGECGAVVEFRVRTRSGAWRSLEVRTRNLLSDPAVAGVVVNCRDVTDERVAEQVQHRLNAFLEATPDFVATFDPRGRALSINAAFRQAMGIEDEEIESLTIPDLYPPSVTEQLLHVGVPTALREGMWAGETSLQTKDGRQIPISQLILAHRGPNGAVEFLSTLGRDISDRKRAEEALRESESHFRSLIENAQDIITILDPDGMILYESAAVQRVLGYAPEELLGRNCYDLVHPDDRGSVAAALADVVRQPGTTRRIELRVQHKDGSWRDLEAVGQQSPEGAPVAGVVVNARDLSERKQAEAALRESEEQLRQAQKMEAVGRLAGGIAHDFNNLLTAIKGFTELLHLDLDEQDPRRAYVVEIQNASNRAAALTRQLLAFSRKQVLQPKVIDLNASVLDMEKMLRRLIGEDVELVTQLDRQLGRTKADPGQVEQVILNLVVNARDAMPAGGRLTVTTANAVMGEDGARRPEDPQPGDYVVLSVADTGTGMSPEVRERVFEPFFTTKEQGKGTGLGLSTVYGIVKQSGGYVVIESEVGQGSEFRIYLPRVQAEVEQPAERVEQGPLNGSETVLLVEDELAVRTLVRRVLDRHGYQVLEAGGGAEALERLQAHSGPVHLLLTDVVMPGMSGRELAEKVTAQLPQTRVLYMSGYTDEAIVHHGVLESGVAFLEKPFTPDRLLHRVRQVLESSVRAD